MQGRWPEAVQGRWPEAVGKAAAVGRRPEAVGEAGGWCCAPRTRCDVRLVKVPPSCDLRLKPQRVSPQRRQLPMVLRFEELEELVEVSRHLRAGVGQDGLKQNGLNRNGYR